MPSVLSCVEVYVTLSTMPDAFCMYLLTIFELLNRPLLGEPNSSAAGDISEPTQEMLEESFVHLTENIEIITIKFVGRAIYP